MPGDGTKIFVENYYPQLRRDVEAATEALKATLPETIREAIEGELRKLQGMLAVLDGQQEKNPLSQLRAELRWRRVDLAEAKEPAERKRLDQVIHQIESDIRKHSKGRRK